MSEPGTGAGELEGQAALVTGASSGLGRAVVAALARRGADAALVAASPDATGAPAADYRGYARPPSGSGLALALPAA